MNLSVRKISMAIALALVLGCLVLGKIHAFAYIGGVAIAFTAWSCGS